MGGQATASEEGRGNEFIYALAFDARAAETTVSVGVPTVLIGGDVFFWQSLQAATLLVALPWPSCSTSCWRGSSPASRWERSRADV